MDTTITIPVWFKRTRLNLSPFLTSVQAKTLEPDGFIRQLTIIVQAKTLEPDKLTITVQARMLEPDRFDRCVGKSNKNIH